MRDDVKRLDILRIDRDRAERRGDVVSVERRVTIVVDDSEFATLMCSPTDLDRLAVGRLRAEGVIRDGRDLMSIDVDEAECVVRIETNLAGREAVRSADFDEDDATHAVTSSLRMPHSSICSLMDEFQRRSETFALTGSVHGAALCDKDGIIVFKEDIGRRNALDKVTGECVLEGIETRDRILVTSGRITSETVARAAMNHTPVIVSKAAPTDSAVKLGDRLGITVIGFARSLRMNIYSNPSRIDIPSRNPE
jgi:FdhD protein